MFRANAISVLVAIVLIAVVGAQTWYMADIKQQLNDLKSDRSSNLMQKNTTMPDPVVKTKDSTGIVSGTNKSPAKNQPDVTDKTLQPLDNKPSLLDDDFFNTPFSAPFNAQTWNPYEEIQKMQRDMDKMFNNSFERFNHSPDFKHLFRQSVIVPKLDLREDDDKYTVIVDLPGTDQSNISVSVDDQVLTVKGHQDIINQREDANGSAIFKERRSGSFERSITLPGPVKQNEMETKIDNGVLVITLPKT